MAAIINAVSGGAGGIIVAGDTTGQLQLQTAGATAMTVNASQQASFVNTVSMPNTFGFKNRIINGAILFDQRHSGSAVTFSGTGQAAGGNYTVDRFQYASYGGNFPSGVYTTLQQVSDAPTGFQSSLKVTANQTLTVGSSNARGSWVLQPIEGFNIYDCYNQSITISFWVKTSNIGTYSLVVQSGDVTAGYATSYVVTTANTWQKIIITLPLTTTTWTAVNYTNSTGITLIFGLLGDPTWIGTGTANTWVTGNIPYLWNCKNLYDTSGATWQVTGVQLEAGTQATAFDYRSFTTELQLCQRYCVKVLGRDLIAGTGSSWGAVGWNFNSNSNYAPYQLPVQMRSSAAMSVINTASISNYGVINTSGTPQTATNLILDTPDVNRPVLRWDSTGNLTSAAPGAAYTSNSNNFTYLTSEL